MIYSIMVNDLLSCHREELLKETRTLIKYFIATKRQYQFIYYNQMSSINKNNHVSHSNNLINIKRSMEFSVSSGLVFYHTPIAVYFHFTALVIKNK